MATDLNRRSLAPGEVIFRPGDPAGQYNIVIDGEVEVRSPHQPCSVFRSPSEVLALLAEVVAMAAVSIRNLDDTVRERLRVRAAAHGRSMEAEIRDHGDHDGRDPLRH
jgi:hypothetical protein